MSFGGFGLSPGDFVLLVQLARRTFRNCQQAGDEYAEIASEVRCLYSVLRSVRKLAKRPDSNILRQDPATTPQLISCANGCKNVLDDLNGLLAKFTALSGEGHPSVPKKIWQRFKFGSNIQELGVVRGKLIIHTSTMSILFDTMQSQALDRVENKIDDGFGEVKGEFERMRREIKNMATQARALDKNGSSLSLLSLSTYAGDEKEVWRAFRRELITKGFRSQSLDKYGHILQAYMLKLDQSGLLEKGPSQDPASAHEMPWRSNRMFADTVTSLIPLSLRSGDEEPSNTGEASPQVDDASVLGPPGRQGKPRNENVGDLQEPPKDAFPQRQDIEFAYEPVPSKPRVTFATILTSGSWSGSNENGRSACRTKTILRHPTPKFPEDPGFFPEGIGLREQSLGGKVPFDARLTILDMKKVHITAIRWLIPRCEKRTDCVVVFKLLEDWEIKVLTDITDLLRGTAIDLLPIYTDTNIFVIDYPHLELHNLFEPIGALSQMLRQVAYHNEYYPYQHNQSTSSWYEDIFQRSRLDLALDAMLTLVIDIGNISKADHKLLDERLTILGVDIRRFIAKELNLPDAIILEVFNGITKQLVRRFLHVSKFFPEQLEVKDGKFHRIFEYIGDEEMIAQCSDFPRLTKEALRQKPLYDDPCGWSVISNCSITSNPITR